MIDVPVTSIEPRWELDLSLAPKGRKLLAMNPSGVAVFATLSASNLKYFVAWCPLPKLNAAQKDILHPRRKEEK
jgi:hypothetical protein